MNNSLALPSSLKRK